MRKHELIQRLSPVSRTLSEMTMQSVSLELCEAVDSPRSLAVHLLLKAGEYAQLVNLEVNPDNYDEPKRFADDYLVSKFLSKYPDFSHEELDPEGKALESFFKFEDICKETNIRFKSLDLDPSLWDPSSANIFKLARRKIKSVLRDPDLVRISDGFGWGPGATTSASGNRTSAYVKFAQRLDVTSNTLIMGHCCVNSTPAWVNCQLQTDQFPSVDVHLTKDAFNIVRGNEIVFVPKNAKTHRIIAKEPHVNSYLQKGFGAEIRRLLRIHAGVDLKDQTLNQRLAKHGSLHGDLATIDLQGASDTISHELVRYLLPEKWYVLLDQIRSKQGFLRKKGSWISYQKFSSMGNACTFELESLIFWALCKSCLEVNGGEQTLNVYGDDIVVPTMHYAAVAKVLSFAGFTINAQKSFSSGRFRESCGKDYFDGIDVRPIFLKENISNVESLFKLANSIRRYAHRRNFNCGCDHRLLNCWQHVVDRIPEPFRNLKIPDGFGDSGLVVNLDEACPSRPQRGWGGWLFKGLVRLPLKEAMRDRHAGYTAVLSVAGNRAPVENLLGQMAFRAITAGYKSLARKAELEISADFVDSFMDTGLPLQGSHDLRKMTFPRVTRIHTWGWYDLGPWNN
jgi:hypothetical protein